MKAPTPPAPATNVLIVSGLKREAAIVDGPGCLAICGDGPTLRTRLADLSHSPIHLVVSWGICGGLDPALEPGDVLLGTEVVSADERIPTDQALTASFARRLIDARKRLAVERVVGVDAPVLSARAKAELRRASGAAAVDMESLTAGRFALERRTPFVILRAVADPAGRDLPPLVAGAVDSEGRVRAAAILRQLIRSPGQLAGLVAAASDSKAAFKALGRCRGLLAGLFLGLGSADL